MQPGMVMREHKAVARSKAEHLQSASWHLVESAERAGWLLQASGGWSSGSSRPQVCFLGAVFMSEPLWLHNEKHHTSASSCCHSKFCSRQIRVFWRAYLAVADFVLDQVVLMPLRGFQLLIICLFLTWTQSSLEKELCLFRNFIKCHIPKVFWYSPESPIECYAETTEQQWQSRAVWTWGHGGCSQSSDCSRHGVVAARTPNGSCMVKVKETAAGLRFEMQARRCHGVLPFPLIPLLLTKITHCCSKRL